MNDTIVFTAIISPFIGLVVWIIKQEYSRQRGSSAQNTPDLINHHLFTTYFDMKMRFLGTQWETEDEGRTLVVRTVMLNKLKIWKKHLIDLAIELDEKCESSCTKDKLSVMNFKTLNKAISESKNFYKNDSSFSKQEQEIFDIFTSGYEAYQKQSVREIENYITRATQSKYANDKKALQSSIFDAYISMFNILFLDISDTIANINGELTGKVINGVEIGELEHEE